MNQNEHALPQARTTEIVTKDMPDEVLVYDLKTHKAHCLNQTAAAVWKHCDGKTSVTEIAMLLKRDLNPTVDEAAVWLAVERLSRAQLLEEQVTVPQVSSRLSRRNAMRQLGLGTAVALPLVMSIVAPTAMAGASVCFTPTGRPEGCDCAAQSECNSGCCDQQPSAPTFNTCTPVTPTTRLSGTIFPGNCPPTGTQGDCCSRQCVPSPPVAGPGPGLRQQCV
jgi:Coenzyme PQQ synthesis protein D (PqqD)